MTEELKIDNFNFMRIPGMTFTGITNKNKSSMETELRKILIDNGMIETEQHNKAIHEILLLFGVSKRYFLFGCVNADKQKLNKLIIADDKESAIADIETGYPYIER